MVTVYLEDSGPETPIKQINWHGPRGVQGLVGGFLGCLLPGSGADTDSTYLVPGAIETTLELRIEKISVYLLKGLLFAVMGV